MITVFTPTYNRANILYRVYDSLIYQTNKNFKWLIVDDGSNDNTRQLIDSWIAENKIEITYIYKENAGKAYAFNTGVENTDTELFFCVDSDDYLTKTAIEDILNAWNIHKNDENICGVLAVKVEETGQRLSDKFPVDLKICDTYNLSNKYNCKGEFALIYKTDILINFLFPKLKNTKFIGELVVYDLIAQKYSMILLDKVVNICEYQADGLSNNIVKTMLNNPKGYKVYYKQRIDMALTFKERFNYIIRYNAFSYMSKESEHNYKGKYSLLCFIAKPIGLLLRIYYKRKIKD